MQQHNTLLCTCWNANYNNCSQGFIYKPRFILGGDTKLLTLIKASESFKHNLVIINFAIVKSLILVTCSHPLSPYCHIYFFCLDQNDFAENFCSTGTKCPEPCKCSHGESGTKTRVKCDHNKNNKTMNKVKQLLVLIEYFAIETKKSRLNIWAFKFLLQVKFFIFWLYFAQSAYFPHIFDIIFTPAVFQAWWTAVTWAWPGCPRTSLMTLSSCESLRMKNIGSDQQKYFQETWEQSDHRDWAACVSVRSQTEENVSQEWEINHTWRERTNLRRQILVLELF